MKIYLAASAPGNEKATDPPAEKKAPAKDKKPAAKKEDSATPKIKVVTRKDAFVMVLQKIDKKGITVLEFNEKVVKILEDSGKSKVGRLGYECKFFFDVMEGISILKEDKGRYSLV